MSRNNLLIVSLIILAGLAGGLTGNHLYNHGPGAQDSHKRNLEYLRWKAGRAGYDPQLALRFLNVDVKFRRSLEGKSKEEAARWFPDLRDKSEANEYQQEYSRYVRDMDFLWIGDSAWGIEFENGKVKDFHLWKG